MNTAKLTSKRVSAGVYSLTYKQRQAQVWMNDLTGSTGQWQLSEGSYGYGDVEPQDRLKEIKTEWCRHVDEAVGPSSLPPKYRPKKTSGPPTYRPRKRRTQTVSPSDGVHNSGSMPEVRPFTFQADRSDPRFRTEEGRLTPIGWLIVLTDEHSRGETNPVESNLTALLSCIERECPDLEKEHYEPQQKSTDRAENLKQRFKDAFTGADDDIPF